MEGFELVLAMAVVCAVVVTISRRVNIAWPILLTICGLGLGLLPGLGHLELAPELVLVVFLPPLLFYAAWWTPVRDLRRYRRPILLLSVGLVLFTTLVVGVVGSIVIAGIPIAAAFALGAIVAPPDAIAATAVLRQLTVPRRVLVILEGESLVNDATALTAYRIAIVTVASGSFVLTTAVADFAYVVLVGLLVGIVVAVAVGWLWARLFDPPVEVTLSLVIPYAAYLPAEQLHGSGVIAVVTAGLYLGFRSSRILAADARLLGAGVWEIVTFLLNGFAFLLIGLQMPVILGELGDRPAGELAFQAVVICLAVILARFAWVYSTAHLPRAIRRHGLAEPRPSRASAFIVAWTGMRGAVSLAAALALPLWFPERSLLIFLTFCVIIVTLVGQGLPLPWMLRRMGVSSTGGDAGEEAVARRATVDAALEEIDRLRERWPEHLPLLDRLQANFEHRAEHLAPETEDGTVDQERMEHQAILASINAVEREAVIELRDRGVIEDGVLRRIERELDLEALRLSSQA